MKLAELLDLKNKKSDNKDVLEYSWIKIDGHFLEEDYYSDHFNKLPKANYFISDLDWTFFRWMLSKETFSLFIKYIRKQNFLDLDLNKYKEFVDDIFVFNELEIKAYNKEVKYSDYIDAWTFLLFKYKELVNRDLFLEFLKNSFKQKQKVNPYRFSMKKLIEVLDNWDNFLFVSGAPSFTLNIYLKLLKDYITNEFGIDCEDRIFWYWSYINPKLKHSVLMFWYNHKDKFIKHLKEEKIINKVIWWMWDSKADFWISNNIDDWYNFYFVNPDAWVVNNFKDLENQKINYEIIFERKDLIFKTDLDNIKVI